MPVAEAPQPITAEQEAEWQAKIDAAFEGKTPVGKEPESEPLTLSQALALPQPLEDLWPGHCYLPPKLKQSERLLQLGKMSSEKWAEGDIFGSMKHAAEFVATVARKIEGEDLAPVTEDEILEEFNADELTAICDHILKAEGFVVEGASGKSPSGRPIGAMSFHSSAAITEPTTSASAENSPTDSTEQ